MINDKTILLRSIVIAAFLLPINSTSLPAVASPLPAVLLAWGETWNAEQSKAPQLVILSSDLNHHTLTIAPSVSKKESSINNSEVIYMRYWCQLTDHSSRFSEVNLSELAGNSEGWQTFCSQSTIPFSIKAVRSDSPKYRLRLVRPSISSQSETLANAVTLQIVSHRVNDGISIATGKLYVMTLDAWNDVPILTDNALDSLNDSLSARRDPSHFVSLDFLNRRLVRLLDSVPAFLRPLISVAVALSPDTCDSLQFSRSILLASNYIAKFDAPNMDQMLLAHLDTATRRLSFNAAKLKKKIIQQLQGKAHICAVLSLSGRQEPYERRKRLGQYYFHINTKTSSTRTSERGSNKLCTLINPMQTVKQLTLLSGLAPFHLLCPIMCSNSGGNMYRFYRNGERIEPIKLPDERAIHKWTPATNGLMTALDGRLVELPRMLTQQEHGGNYSCRAGDAKADFFLHVDAIPSWIRRPPNVVYVAEADRLSLKCEVNFHSSESSHLMNLNLKLRFCNKSGLCGTAPESDQQLNRNNSRSITINADALVNRTVELDCSVQPDEKTLELGLHQIASQSQIVLVRKPQPVADIHSVRIVEHCSWRHLCLIPAKIDMEFRITSSLVSYLANIGVGLSSYAQLGGQAMTKEMLLKRSWQDALKVKYDPKKFTILFSVDLGAVKANPELLNVFTRPANANRISQLTLELNYHYEQQSDSITSDALSYASKTNYNGRDTVCLEDPTCFFSTAYSQQSGTTAFVISVSRIAECADSALFWYRLAFLVTLSALVCAVLVMTIGFVKSRLISTTSRSSSAMPSPKSDDNAAAFDSATYDVLLFVKK